MGTWEGTFGDWLRDGPALMAGENPPTEVRITDRASAKGFDEQSWYRWDHTAHPFPADYPFVLPTGPFFYLRNTTIPSTAHYTSNEEAMSALSVACLEWAKWLVELRKNQK